MKTVPSPMTALGILASLALAGCGGASSPGQSAALLPSSGLQSTLAQTRGAAIPEACTGTGGVTVIPCRIKLQPAGQTTVTVSDQTHQIVNSSETDTCNGLVTFVNTQFYGQWQVTAGTQAVKCKAVFSGLNAKNKVVGKATLHIIVT